MTGTQNIAQNIIRSYQEVPDELAVTLMFSNAAEINLTYRQLVDQSLGYAQLLADARVLPGEVVILILQHGQDLITAFFGAILHGAIPAIMPFLTEKLLPDHYRQGLEALFEISKPGAVITYPEFSPEVRLAARQSDSIRAILESKQVFSRPQISLDQLPGISRPAQEIVLLQHSSGTTGLQKGVALSHQAVFNQLASYAKALKLNTNDVVVSWLPLYHDMGLIAGFLLPILSRLHLALLSPFDWVRAPYKLLQAITKFQGTLCWLPNFAYNFCAQKIRDRDLEGVDLSSLRAVINCSEPMRLESHQAFLHRFSPHGLKPEALATCYAMAENVFAVTQGGIDEPVTIDWVDSAMLIQDQVAFPARSTADQHQENAVAMLSAGRPIENTRIRVIDAQGVDLPERRIGEIILHSDCMLTGYYRRPDLSEQAFLDGWYRTGDLGYLACGELYVTGRKKDLIIVGGKNIYPQDLERLAAQAPGVHPGRVVAFGIYNEINGTEDVALIAELDDYEKLSEQQRQQIAAMIRQIVTQGSDIALRQVHLAPRNWLLKTSSGKIARSANRDKYLKEIT